MATKKKKPKPQPIEPDEAISQFDLSQSQKIILTRENFILLKNFVTGRFPESYGEPYERLKITPERCPFCRFAGGWDYVDAEVSLGPVHAGFGKEYFRQNRVVQVQCLSCGQLYKVTESWLIYFEVEELAPAGQT